jgi:hypothetical protein
MNKWICFNRSDFRMKAKLKGSGILKIRKWRKRVYIGSSVGTVPQTPPAHVTEQLLSLAEGFDPIDLSLITVVYHNTSRFKKLA